MSRSTPTLNVETAEARTAIAVFDALAPRLQALYRSYVEDPYRSTFVYSRKKIDMVIEGVLRGLPQTARVIDVGCGTGFHLTRLRQQGFDVTGVEPGPHLRALARDNNPGTTIEDAYIENLPFPDASFDVALAIEVLRYLADPVAAAAELARVIRPGGLAIFTLPPRWSLTGYALLNRLTSKVQIPTFVKLKQGFFTQRKAHELIRRAGFACMEIHGVTLGPWQAIERVSPGLLPQLLRAFEPIDDRLSDRPLLRDFSGILVVVAKR